MCGQPHLKQLAGGSAPHPPLAPPSAASSHRYRSTISLTRHLKWLHRRNGCGLSVRPVPVLCPDHGTRARSPFNVPLASLHGDVDRPIPRPGGSMRARIPYAAVERVSCGRVRDLGEAESGAPSSVRQLLNTETSSRSRAGREQHLAMSHDDGADNRWVPPRVRIVRRPRVLLIRPRSPPRSTTAMRTARHRFPCPHDERARASGVSPVGASGTHAPPRAGAGRLLTTGPSSPPPPRHRGAGSELPLRAARAVSPRRHAAFPGLPPPRMRPSRPLPPPFVSRVEQGGGGGAGVHPRK